MFLKTAQPTRDTVRYLHADLMDTPFITTTAQVLKVNYSRSVTQKKESTYIPPDIKMKPMLFDI